MSLCLSHVGPGQIVSCRTQSAETRRGKTHHNHLTHPKSSRAGRQYCNGTAATTVYLQRRNKMAGTAWRPNVNADTLRPAYTVHTVESVLSRHPRFTLSEVVYISLYIHYQNRHDISFSIIIFFYNS